MSETAIDIQDLIKVYRLYKKPHYRFLDVFGLLWNGKGAYSENKVLDIDRLSIRRGEKVAIIGRNGAGKSTLLKLIGGVVSPTSGHVKAQGEVHALLQIGTGFHPDLTGRENVLSYLVHMGASQSETQDSLNDIIEFTELEEYIDQPLKTYSTGMGVRLMFATSTAIAPDILILDEVLSVGDAYFVQKSYERMKSLCDREGTTVLLVSHDIYSASYVCERMIWIDRGRIVLDGACSDVIKAYETSIRLQEENRLRQRVLKSNEKDEREEGFEGYRIFFQIVPENRLNMTETLPIKALRLSCEDNMLNEITMQEGLGKGEGAFGSLIIEDSSWGVPYQKNGSWWRDFQTFGSIFHRVPFQFTIPHDLLNKPLTIEVEWLDQGLKTYFLECYGEDGQTVCYELETQGDRNIRTVSVPIEMTRPQEGMNQFQQLHGLSSQSDLSVSGKRIGNKRLQIEKVVIEDGKGLEKLLFAPNEEMDIVISFQVMDKQFSDSPTFMATILKNGFSSVTRMMCDDLHVEASGGTIQTLKMKLRPHRLGPGEYSLNVGIFDHGYLNQTVTPHCSINPMVIDLMRDCAFIEVNSAIALHHNIAYSQSAIYELNAENY